MENTLDRITSAASPRTIERVVRGAKFSMELVYDVEDPERVTEDLKEVLACLRLLEDDYLGGSGSRGYGRIAINNVEVELPGLDIILALKNLLSLSPSMVPLWMK